MKIPEWTIGERLAKARRDADLTQDQMAARFNVTRQTIINWEKMRSEPTGFLAKLEKWAAITEVHVGWLILGDAHNPRIVNLRVVPNEDDQQTELAFTPPPQLASAH